MNPEQIEIRLRDLQAKLVASSASPGTHPLYQTVVELIGLLRLMQGSPARHD